MQMEQEERDCCSCMSWKKSWWMHMRMHWSTRRRQINIMIGSWSGNNFIQNKRYCCSTL